MQILQHWPQRCTSKRRCLHSNLAVLRWEPGTQHVDCMLQICVSSAITLWPELGWRTLAKWTALCRWRSCPPLCTQKHAPTTCLFAVRIAVPSPTLLTCAYEVTLAAVQDQERLGPQHVGHDDAGNWAAGEPSWKGPWTTCCWWRRGRQQCVLPALHILPSETVWPVCRCLWRWTHITSVQIVASMLQKLGSCDAPDLQRTALLHLNPFWQCSTSRSLQQAINDAFLDPSMMMTKCFRSGDEPGSGRTCSSACISVALQAAAEKPAWLRATCSPAALAPRPELAGEPPRAPLQRCRLERAASPRQRR